MSSTSPTASGPSPGTASPSAPPPPPTDGPSASPGPLPFRPTSNAPFKTDVVRRTALSTATLLRTSKPGGANGPGGLTSHSTNLLGGDDGKQLTEAQLAKLEENVNVKIDNEIQILLDGFRQIVGLSLIRDKDRYLLAQESYQAEMRAHNMVRAAQSLTLLSASLKLSLILSLEPEDKDMDRDDGTTESRRTEAGGGSDELNAKELIKDTERLWRRCAELLSKLGVGTTSVESEATTDSSSEGTGFEAESGATRIPQPSQRSDQPDVNAKSVP
ncbi:hypothetical protein V8E36_002895 [Tilletia maclaganii]